MAYRQYIGARYVPLFDGVWNATKNYEPLTVVEDGNGNSYTSKKDVPAGTPLTDRNYWILTATFSGAVEHLQNRMQAAETSINDINDRIDGVDESITAIGLRIDGVEDEIEHIFDEKVLFISDSYGGILAGSYNFAQLFTQYTAIQSDLSWIGSAGFGAAIKFLSPLTAYAGDRDKITKIIVVGGANDLPENLSDIYTGMQEFVAYAKQNYVNCRAISIFVCGVAFNGAGSTPSSRTALVQNYISSAARLGVSIITNSQYALHDTALMSADMVHPNDGGITYIAQLLSECWKNDVANIDKHIYTYISLYEGVTIPEAQRVGWVRQNIKNGNASISAAQGILFEVSFTGEARPFVRESGGTSVANIGIVRNLIFTGNIEGVPTSAARVTLNDGRVFSGFAYLFFGVGTMHVFFAIPEFTQGASTSYVTNALLYDTFIPAIAE